MTEKEMTEYGPQQRLGDYLEACIHQAFTSDADYMLKDGKISREERIMLSGAIGSALDTFHNAVPEEVRTRVIGPEDSKPMIMHSLTKLFGQVEDKIKTVFGGRVEEKEFDTSPWNGSASQWDTAAAYCSDCLIDENESGTEKSKDKCHLPYRKPGSTQINKNALRAIGAGARSLTQVNASSESKKKAANWVISHWKSAFGTAAPASMYRIAGKTPPGREEKSAFRVLKDNSGDLWAILVYSNKWADRVEDILSEKAHARFSDWVNKSGFRPQITLFHLPHLPASFWTKVFKKYHNDIPSLNAVVKAVFRDTGLAIAEVERVVYLNGFSMMIGKVYSDMQDVAEKLSDMEDVGSSHAFLVGDFTPREEKGMIVDEYLSFEGSGLPRSRAANPVTMFAVEEKDMTEPTKELKLKMSDDDRQWMENLLGPERMAKIDANTEKLQGKLDTFLSFKAVAEDEEDMEEEGKEKTPAKEKVDDPPVVETPADPPVTEPEVPAPVDAKAIAAEVMKLMNVEELQKVIATLSEDNKALREQLDALKSLPAEVAALKKSDDEKIAAQITPINWTMPVFQPSKATPPVEKTPEEVKKEAPHNPDAKSTNPNDVMSLGLFSMLQPSNQ